jgi:hypothetical protein
LDLRFLNFKWNYFACAEEFFHLRQNFGLVPYEQGGDEELYSKQRFFEALALLPPITPNRPPREACGINVGYLKGLLIAQAEVAHWKLRLSNSSGRSTPSGTCSLERCWDEYTAKEATGVAEAFRYHDS